MELTGTPIVVLGMLRSGTSSVAQALHKLGVHLGEPDELKPADVDNQDGYWEHLRLRGANDQVMMLLGMVTNHAKMIPSNWRDYERIDLHVARIKALLGKTFAGNELWGWKDPPTTLLVPMYEDIFSDLGLEPRYVICVRNPLDVAASMLRRGFNQSTEMEAIGVWLQYTLGALHATTGKKRIVICFHEFLSDPAKCLVPLVDSVPGWAPDTEAWQRVKAVPRKELNHGERDLKGVAKIAPSIIGKTFELCLEAGASPDAFNRGDFDTTIQTLWDEFQSWRLIHPSSPSPTSRFSLRWMVPGQQTPSQVFRDFVPSPIRESLSVSLDAPTGAMVFGELATTPGTVMVRSMTLIGQNGVRKEIRAEALGGVGFTKSEDVSLWTITGPGNHFAFQMPPGGEAEFVIEIAMDQNPIEVARIASAAGQENAFWRSKAASQGKPFSGTG